MIRMRGDKLVSITLLVGAAGLIALPGLFFVPVPLAAAWPFLIASALVHVGYNSFLALAYHHGELTKVYPLVRGSAPLTTLAISLLFLHEDVDASEVLGIVVLAGGIMVLRARRRPACHRAPSPHVLLYAGRDLALHHRLYALRRPRRARSRRRQRLRALALRPRRAADDRDDALHPASGLRRRDARELESRRLRRRVVARRLLDRDLGDDDRADPDRRGAARNEHPLRADDRNALARRAGDADSRRSQSCWSWPASL